MEALDADHDSDIHTDPQEALLQAIPELRNLPPGIQVCVIQESDALFLYNVDRAHEMIRGRAPNAVVDVTARAKLIHPRGAGLPPEDMAQVDVERAMTVDLSYPVLLLGTMPEMDGSTGGRLIDGWHRVYKAAQLGICELPAIVIGAEEEPLIRMHPAAGAAT